jgi:pimeloyl-ACP methyl ester carboxylesterase
MKQIYFKGDKAQSMWQRTRKAATRFATGSSMRLFPNRTTRWAESILCAASRSKRTLLPLDFVTTEIDIHNHKISVYRAGNFNRSIVFVHGWSGSSADFNAFYQPALNQGFNVITFDHVAHGKSQGRVANLFLFIRATEQVLASHGNQTQISAIVAHSLGGSAVINAVSSAHPNTPIALIAPVIPLFETMYKNVDDFGIARSWLDKLLASLEKRYGKQLKEIDPKLIIANFKNPVLTLHDRDDRYISLQANKQHFSTHVTNSLRETEGLGHFKILAAPSVVSDVVEFVSAHA